MARITRISNNRSWLQMLKQNSETSLLMLCERLGLKEEWESSMQDPARFLKGCLQERPEFLILLFSEAELDLLLSVWDRHAWIEDDYSSRSGLRSLELPGLLRYDHQKQTIAVCEEAKRNFYFSLKSRTVQKKKAMYQELEYTVKGILYVYGIVELYKMYDIIEEEYAISYTELYEFLVARMDLWSFLGILRNTKTKEYYALSYEVRERNQVFRKRAQDPDREYAKISAQDAQALGRMNGIGNWKGTQQLLTYGLERLYEDVMPATVLVKTLLVYVQNGDSLEEIRQKAEGKLSDFSQEEKEYVWECIRDMYWYTPIHHLKGHYRREPEEEDSFFVIEGGRI